MSSCTGPIHVGSVNSKKENRLMHGHRCGRCSLLDLPTRRIEGGRAPYDAILPRLQRLQVLDQSLHQ